MFYEDPDFDMSYLDSDKCPWCGNPISKLSDKCGKCGGTLIKS